MIHLTGVMLILGATAIARAQTTAPTIPRDIEQRIAAGLAYLATQQKPDGSFDDGNAAQAMPTTGLALLAYYSAGHMPDEGKHGIVVRGALDYLVGQATAEDGYFQRTQNVRLSDFAIVTLALAESCGVEPDAAQRRQTRAALDRGVAALLARQKLAPSDPASAGGWRDLLDDRDEADSITTALAVLALRAAREAGATIGREPLNRATGFLLSCRRDQEKGFGVRPGAGSSPPTTAAALLGLRLLGAGASPQSAEGAFYLGQNLRWAEGGPPHLQLYLLAHYAHLNADLWPSASAAIYPAMVRRQLPEGSFRPVGGEPGRMLDRNRARAAHATAAAILTLSTPSHLLPIQQK